MYRTYIQRSRGELSCVKPSCVKLQNGWVSDRSLCYLASGKPVVTQDTGPSPYLPFGDGILRFSTSEEAAEALATVNAHYQRHCRSAREIAETYFDARQIAERILNVALA
jgi:glycosyltransferase involved in cell wall biosynthesis